MVASQPKQCWFGRARTLTCFLVLILFDFMLLLELAKFYTVFFLLQEVSSIGQPLFIRCPKHLMHSSFFILVLVCVGLVRGGEMIWRPADCIVCWFVLFYRVLSRTWRVSSAPVGNIMWVAVCIQVTGGFV